MPKMAAIQQVINEAKESGVLPVDVTSRPQWEWLENFVNRYHPFGVEVEVNLNLVWRYLILGDTHEATGGHSSSHKFVQDLERLLEALPKWQIGENWIWQDPSLLIGRKIEVDLRREVLFALSVLHAQGPPLTRLLAEISMTLGLDLKLPDAIFQDSLSQYCIENREVWVGANFSNVNWRDYNLDDTKMPQPALPVANQVDLNSILCHFPSLFGGDMAEKEFGVRMEECSHDVVDSRQKGKARATFADLPTLVDSRDQRVSQEGKSQEDDVKGCPGACVSDSQRIDRGEPARGPIRKEQFKGGACAFGQKFDLESLRSLSIPRTPRLGASSIRPGGTADDEESSEVGDGPCCAGDSADSENDDHGPHGAHLNADDPVSNPKVASELGSQPNQRMELLAQEIDHLSRLVEELRHDRDSNIERLEKELRQIKWHRKEEEIFFRAKIPMFERQPEIVVAYLARLKGLDDEVAALRQAMNDVDARLDWESKAIGDMVRDLRHERMMVIRSLGDGA